MDTTTSHRGNFRAQKKGQNARQAMMISGLSTIYRNNTSTHFIQTRQHTEPRVYFLDITLEEMGARYAKIHQIIEKGRLRPKGTELFFVYKKMEHFILSQDAIYEIRVNDATRQQTIHERIPVDGPVRTIEITNTNAENNVNILVDESYYELTPTPARNINNNNNNNNTLDTPTATPTCISTNHIVIRQMKKVVKTHPKSMNAFVFILNETETEVIDFYMTTENGVIGQSDVLTRTCKDDIISFLEQFKLYS
jgi:hypothetical protein